MSNTDMHYQAIAQSMHSTHIKWNDAARQRHPASHPLVVAWIAYIAIVIALISIASHYSNEPITTVKTYAYPEKTRQ